MSLSPVACGLPNYCLQLFCNPELKEDRLIGSQKIRRAAGVFSATEASPSFSCKRTLFYKEKKEDCNRSNILLRRKRRPRQKTCTCSLNSKVHLLRSIVWLFSHICSTFLNSCQCQVQFHCQALHWCNPSSVAVPRAKLAPPKTIASSSAVVAWHLTAQRMVTKAQWHSLLQKSVGYHCEPG